MRRFVGVSLKMYQSHETAVTQIVASEVVENNSRFDSSFPHCFAMFYRHYLIRKIATKFVNLIVSSQLKILNGNYFFLNLTCVVSLGAKTQTY